MKLSIPKRYKGKRLFVELWKDIIDYEGLYQISNLGRVKSLNYNKTGKEKILKAGKDKDGYLQVGLSYKGEHKSHKVHRLVAIHFIPNPDNLPQVNHKDENKENNRIDNLEWCTHEYNQNYGTRTQRASKSRKGKYKGENSPLYGKHHSEETKAKMSENNPKGMTGKHHTEESKKKMSESHKGKHHSEEAIKKMSESHKGENHPMYGKGKPVYCLELDKTYPNAKQCAEELGLWSSCIRDVCNGKQKQTKGYHFYYVENILYMN